jgi:hypothetical protein
MSVIFVTCYCLPAQLFSITHFYILLRWDNKTKKYVRVQDDKKKIKTESGVYISATYKTNRYVRLALRLGYLTIPAKFTRTVSFIWPPSINNFLFNMSTGN